ALPSAHAGKQIAPVRSSDATHSAPEPRVERQVDGVFAPPQSSALEQLFEQIPQMHRRPPVHSSPDLHIANQLVLPSELVPPDPSQAAAAQIEITARQPSRTIRVLMVRRPPFRRELRPERSRIVRNRR